ncbi:MAG TPA: M24 family metallopeptidase [Euzebyales bacterium]|nr:M24 family metallopeptidase [Euzebyales bacterium]
MAGSTTVAARVRALLDTGYPRFSAGELGHRRAALLALCRDRGLDRLVLYGAQRVGPAVTWVTGWPVTREAAVVMGPGETDALFVQFRNHVPLARELVAGDVDVRWGGAATLRAVADELAVRGGPAQRVGVIGPLPHAAVAPLHDTIGRTVALDAGYSALRLVKSDEELDFLRAGAHLSDLGMEGIGRGLRVGLTERGIVDLAERAYVPHGGTTHICYVGTTSMAAPARGVPAQFPSTRPLAAGDAVVVELSAAFWGYAGQILRTFTVGAPPSPRYRDLHDVADAALAAMLAEVRAGATATQLQRAASVIGEAGYVTCDDLVHGFGGGYLPPVVAAPEHGIAPPDVSLAAGMTVVVQPNVMTADGRAGVQTGELVLVTADGFERLHRVPGGMRTVGGATA